MRKTSHTKCIFYTQTFICMLFNAKGMRNKWLDDVTDRTHNKHSLKWTTTTKNIYQRNSDWCKKCDCTLHTCRNSNTNIKQSMKAQRAIRRREQEQTKHKKRWTAHQYTWDRTRNKKEKRKKDIAEFKWKYKDVRWRWQSRRQFKCIRARFKYTNYLVLNRVQ